ncbi:ATP-dependent DNA helicase RecG [Sediminicoccus sp. KRV36]|uniref:ATP-dependent DNA helicase RecG n=1 Tax=Sediminicoccus sp. KRV36 TaxID=3133721 RepID=UPI00200EC933|nr:ATP-dependent DNA helicase RecG [Sediminicoccus rosea]UPY35561.1 ATP-dependent DNA helicase RecG [Sediminicoccus rosea]
MNPSVSLSNLFEPLETLPGVGPKRAALIAKACGGPRILDLLFHLPDRIAARMRVTHASLAPADQDAVLRVTPISSRTALSRATRRRYVELRTAEEVTLRFMQSNLGWIERLLPQGEARWISGRIRPEGDGWSCINPDVAADDAALPSLEAIWPLTDGLKRGHLAPAMVAALQRLPEMEEWQDAPLLARESWPGFAGALRALHTPQTRPDQKPWERLAYDEALAGQLALALLRRRNREAPGRPLAGDGALRGEALARFGHPPTPDQAKALAEISADLSAPHRMLRLLQGDVGSGKTLVAVLAMLQAVEAGAQAAIMAPTEILARQHLRTLEKLCPVPVALLAGSVKGPERRRVLRGFADGSIRIAIGTHALFQQGVEFRDLGLAVVDEQHRFGVAQRLELAGKGALADMLVMTATPIPRTLQLTQWGEMRVSRIAGKPAGRQPIATRIASGARLPEIIARMRQALERGERAYWVVRAITGGEHDDSIAAETRFAELSELFPGRVGLAHGELEMDRREQALADFATGRTQILVATTVIEVGVDVPEATIILIEQAERFGLSALHQLRGRVGRGSKPSSCLLVHSEQLSERERERLLILRDTEDGFVIAEEDLRLRGGGEALGTRQAGQAQFRLGLRGEDEAAASRAATRQNALIEMAAGDAEVLLTRDPHLTSPRGVAARQLLRLFDKEGAVALLAAG